MEGGDYTGSTLRLVAGETSLVNCHFTDNGPLIHLLTVGHARSGRDLPDGVFTSYDVFDASGLWLHELHVRCEADPDHDGLIHLDDGRVLLVRGLQLARLTASGDGGQVTEEGDGAWAMEVICCRVSE